MDEVPGTSANSIGSLTHVVTVEGCYGSVVWNVGEKLYSLLPRNLRDDATEIAGRRKIGPFFEQVAERMLAHVGSTANPRTLNCEWSLQTLEHSCECVGTVIWQISQGLLDALPEDQRKTMLEVQMQWVSVFLHHEVARPLANFSFKRLTGL